MSDLNSVRDEIELRRASIADAQREHADGELSDTDFAAIVADEERRLDQLETQLSSFVNETPTPSPKVASPTGRRHRRIFLVVALLCFFLAAVGVIFGALSPRQPGDSDTGGLSLATQQQISRLLAQGEIDESNYHDAAAVAAYQSVLALDKNNVEALTQSGWLTFSAGSAAKSVSLVQKGESQVERAVRLAPSDPDPRLYYAIIAASLPNERTFAVQQFKVFLRLKPSAGDLAVAQPWLTQLGVKQ